MEIAMNCSVPRTDEALNANFLSIPALLTVMEFSFQLTAF
jgi:hypothetical protein